MTALSCFKRWKDWRLGLPGRDFFGAHYPQRIYRNLSSSILWNYSVALKTKLSAPKPNRSDPRGGRSWTQGSGEGTASGGKVP